MEMFKRVDRRDLDYNKVSKEKAPFGNVPDEGIEIKSNGGYGWFSCENEKVKNNINIIILIGLLVIYQYLLNIT